MPFSKGQSGNPSGRQRGSRNKATLAVEALLDGEAEALTRKAVELALAGDTVALRLCLDRLAPPRKGWPITLEVGDVTSLNDLSTVQGEVVAALARGELTPEEAADVASVVEKLGQAWERRDLEERIQALEERTTSG
jgi:hypothetical protein